MGAQMLALLTTLAQAEPVSGDSVAAGGYSPVEVFTIHAISGLAFAAIGLLVFALALWLIVRITPFSVRKEIEEDQNVALGVIVGAMLIGISIIIAAAIQG